MGSVVFEVLIILLLVVANGAFAMSEIAVISARKARLQQLVDEGAAGARIALSLANAPGRFLSTVQIGITLIGILAGAYGGATISEKLALELSHVRLIGPYSRAIGVGVVVAGITYLSLVIGELVPKQLALGNAERIACAVAAPLKVLSRMAAPVVHLLTRSTTVVLWLLRVQEPASRLLVTEEEIRIMIRQGARQGLFALSEQEILERVFRLDDRTISTVMTPRTEIVWLDPQAPLEETRAAVSMSQHTRFPVAREGLDQVLGLVDAKDLLVQSMNGQPLDLEAALRPALFVPEGVSILNVLTQLKEAHSQIALVIDEYGSIEGLVTLTDVLEAIVGDMPLPGETIEPGIVQREDGSWLMDGRLLVEEMKEFLGIQELPEEGVGYQTLGGFVMASLGRIPSTSDRFEWAGFAFEVVDMDERRVDKVLVERRQLAADGGEWA